MLTVLPLPQFSCSTAQRGPPRASGKRDPRGTISPARALWEPPLWSYPRGLQGNLTVTEQGAGMQQPAQGSYRRRLHLRCPSSNSSLQPVSSAELNWRHTLTRALSSVQSCLIQILKQGVLPSLEPTSRQGTKSHPVRPEGLVRTPGKCAAQRRSSTEADGQS